nr:hypothetical protein [Mycoplasmopsis bovis]
MNLLTYYGINPNQITDYKGLAGDTSDRLKGSSWHWAYKKLVEFT